MNVASILHEHAMTRGEQPAILERGRAISYAALERAVAAAASRLADACVGRDMRVLVLGPMSIDLYTAVIALFRVGATVVFADPSPGFRSFDACVARVRPHAFVGVPRAHLLRLVSPAVRRVAVKLMLARVVDSGSECANGAAPSPVACRPDAPAIITFTSGSTGTPKAAVRSHGFLMAQHRALAGALALGAGDVDLLTLPVVMLANLASGVTSVIPDADLRAPGAIRPGPVIHQLHRHHVGRIVASPAFLERLVEALEQSGERLTNVSRIATGGAPVFPALLDRLARVAPAASILAVYGSTEAEPIASVDRREVGLDDRQAMRNGRGLLAGVPEAAVDLRVLPDRWGRPQRFSSSADFDRAALGVGEAGEIVVTGDHVLRGYLDGVGDDETKMVAGDRVWHRTGDAGYLDATGRLWLLGRCAARVEDVDGVLYPFAVECAASDVAGVARSAFVSHRGRRLLVVEARDDGAGARVVPAPADLRAALMERLAWARLSDVRIVGRVPVDRRHNAKVDYPALARMLGT
jgi:acyl-CoA synthetase (AMP-forming)/AMP-acid ligase II